uniref:tetrahydrofolate synthase n=1 Tax=Poecilia reticulata TaxID=8081 RepID=A0A3P9NNK0_POERE
MTLPPPVAEPGSGRRFCPCFRVRMSSDPLPVAGRHLHPEHAAEQRQRPAADQQGAEGPPAAAAGHAGLPGAGRAHGGAAGSPQHHPRHGDQGQGIHLRVHGADPQNLRLPDRVLQEAHGGTMPAYFRFLTILAFHVFLQEKVDLAIIEVGIGGAYDCTNVVRRPWVCGITSLGIDHTQILGDTIEKIAWQKAGIFKPGVPAFTVRQPQEAMTVLRDRAREIQCPLRVCPDLDRYQTESGALQLGLAGQHQRSNASLALQLCHTWLQRRCGPDLSPALPDPDTSCVLQADSFRPGATMVKGLAEARWAGRNQTLRRGALTYFLDGAHTHRSMQACVQWFQEAAAQSQSGASGAVVRVLLFNATGRRDAAAMLKLLLACRFDLAVFCPNITETVASGNADQQNFNVAVETMLTCCLDNERSWRLLSDGGDEYPAPLLIRDGPAPLAERKADSLVFPCILSALCWIAQGRDPVLTDPAQTAPPVTPSMAAKAALLQDAAHVQVLVTGSLHLVGGVLKHLDPEDG